MKNAKTILALTAILTLGIQGQAFGAETRWTKDESSRQASELTRVSDLERRISGEELRGLDALLDFGRGPEELPNHDVTTEALESDAPVADIDNVAGELLRTSSKIEKR
ncbi:MAG: hypothetical protein AAF493_27820, partial [Pseudomonadota bacterium]